MIKYKLSFVQGRISPQIGSAYQYFPIDNWQNELIDAKKIGLKNVEWIVSDLSNPIFNPIFFNIIKKSLKKNKIDIASISLDYLMKRPLYAESIEDLNWIVKKLNTLITKKKIVRLNIPIEESSSIYNFSQVSKILKNLNFIKKKLSKNYIISLETDISPQNLTVFLKKKQVRGIGINIDLGNIEANGYNIKEYISKLSNLIYGIHIKNRGSLFSKSKMLKNNKTLGYVLSNLINLKNLNDVTVQSFKDKTNYKKQFIQNFNFINKILRDERI